MPTDGHYDYCHCADCMPKRLAQRERRNLAAMTFHERKAYRIAKRPTPSPQEAPRE